MPESLEPRKHPAPPRRARWDTSISTSDCGSAHAWPHAIASPGRITLARSIIGAIMADEKTLDVLLRKARSHSDFTEQPVHDDTLRAAHELMKWGPTSANSQPMRIVYLKSAESRQRLKPALSAVNVEKTMKA